MNIHKITTPLVAFALLLCVQTVSGADAKYLNHSTVPDGVALLPPLPLPGSPEDVADADEAFHVYSTRTSEQFAQGKDENKLTIFHFAPVIGPRFQPGKFPVTEALFKQMEGEMKVATDELKEHFKRVRPYNAEPTRFPDSIEHEKMTSYSHPSGHSTRGTAYAMILGEIFPGKREALEAKGRETGWLRVQGGVHYPLDVYAGRVWGRALARAFLASPEFQHDLAEAKKELAAAQD